MGITEIILNIFSGISANFATDKIKDTIKQGIDVKEEIESEKQEVKNIVKQKTFPVNMLYTSFSNSNDDLFVSLLDKIFEPNIYVFIETEASTFYNLGIVVIEDNRTKDWYLFGHSVAFQGTGGGWGNTKSFYNIIKQHDNKDTPISLSIRIATNENIDKLTDGNMLWSEFKDYSIPAMICKDEFLKQFQERFEKEIVGK
jgi:hypothetical protein